MDGIRLDELNLPELIELLHQIADEIQIRMMQTAERSREKVTIMDIGVH